MCYLKIIASFEIIEIAKALASTIWQFSDSTSAIISKLELSHMLSLADYIPAHY